MFNLIEKAQAINPPTITPTSATLRLGTVVSRAIDWVLYAAAIVAVIYLIYGGILYITAGGDAEKATKGRTAVINAVIGIIIIVLALVIIRWATGAIGGPTAV